ncbi:lipid kinase [Mesorhizobium sp.]|uniref:lipid kinase n=1 Tax=Mesorhizobium sp. TaxID=1871066 RepID=UPI000FE62C9D|nr:lipid kinase [Mesorhizobium sp.]RWG07253.1 MAG: lipid kinase [Mesorhizobium sp.]RWG96381.1 MAG: lipid kinase [Mesorhizobium sp.]TIN46769.1 MAG: lipid kinase [Mesorhizobium sp.]TIR91813.1 MAG: lipid kinase [Mesorhizobium sp.]TIS04083.1 MAG: lipid kinase [Mesorhizobium sp.]
MSEAAKRRALLLLNPKARRGQEMLAPIVERLGRGRLSVTVEMFEALPEIARDIVRLRHMADLVVVCGGDGSVSSAATAIMESGLPMGIIPMGTANDLARTLNIPMDLLQAADVIARGRTRLIDVGTVNGHAFFNVASIGLSTELAQGLDPALKKRFGRLGYALAAMKVLTRAARFHAKITEKGAAIEVETYQIAVGNGRHYGGGNVVEETAEIDDGHLDLYSLEMTNLWKLALMLRSFRSGTHGAWREVRTARCVEFDIETRKAMPVNTDGEIVTSTPAHFKVRPKAISVFAPDRAV